MNKIFCNYHFILMKFEKILNLTVRKFRQYIWLLMALCYLNNIAYSKEIIWKPSQNEWLKSLSNISFSNGDAIEVLNNTHRLVNAKSLAIKTGKSLTPIDSKIENDIVDILLAYPSNNEAQVALVYSSCSGVICGIGKLHLIYLFNGNLRVEEVFDASSDKAVLSLRIDKKELLSANYYDIDYTRLNAIGDPAVINRQLILGKGFVSEDFRYEFSDLIENRVESFFSNRIARNKLLQILTPEQFKAYRLRFNGSDHSLLVNGILIVYTGCQVYECSSNRSALVFDAQTADAWIVSVDLEKKQMQFTSTRPLSESDITAVQNILNLGVSLTIIDGKLRISQQ